MDKVKESELFAYLCRHRPLKEWLEHQLKRQVDVLMVNPDRDVILKAQAACAFIKTVLDKLEAAEAAAKR